MTLSMVVLRLPPTMELQMLLLLQRAQGKQISCNAAAILEELEDEIEENLGLKNITNLNPIPCSNYERTRSQFESIDVNE